MSKPTTIRIDPEFRSLIPPLAPDEYAQLEANILRDGCRDPLVTWRGVIVDGHNRHRICTVHGIKFETVAKDLADRTQAMLWMIDNQKGRRNVSDYDKGLLALRKQELLRPIAEKQRKETEGRPSKLSAKLPTVSKIDTRRESAKEAGIGERTLDAVKIIKDAAEKGEVDQKTIDDLRQRKVAIHRVAKDIKETRQRKEREGKRVEAVKEIAIPDNLITGDFREHSGKVPDGSVSLIFTDPPYDRKASGMLPDLGKFAAAKLMEGGSLVLYVGQTQIPAALDALRPHLRYWWTIACVHAGRSTVMREYGINACWKAVLWFVKGTRHDNSVMVNDVMSGGQEKSFHDWQQSQSEAEYWILKLTDQDGVVCDPFMGGGTTAAAAKARGRKWIGFETDAANGRIIAERLSK